MVLKSTSLNNVSVYQVSGTNFSRALPDWIIKKRKKSLKNDEEFQHRIELVQDFEFSEASNKIKVTNDGKFCMATGTYKPQIHVYDFDNLALKFERHTDAENVDFVILSDDWTKSVHLQNDRSIEFQNKGGIHYKTRIPHFGRALSYEYSSCNLFVASQGNELYRLNLMKGTFLKPFELDIDSDKGANCIDISSRTSLVSVGLESNVVEFWDPRTRSCVSKLYLEDECNGVTATSFKNDGLHYACGTKEGKVHIYDLRSSKPLITRDQGYDFEIKKLKWLNNNVNNDKAENLILSSDKRIAKIWDTETGKPYASMEPTVDINDVEYIPNSGMFLMANEGIQMHTYYIPNLGPAPEWCSFLDNLTEEMEEKPANSLYSNYKFITQTDLVKLGVAHLVGTKVLKPYMHGYFISTELYDRFRLISNVSSAKDMRNKEIKERIAKETESRIVRTDTKVKVNKNFLHKLQEKKNGDEIAQDLVADERFKDMFENPEFEINEESHEYKQLNPVRNDAKKPEKYAVSEDEAESASDANNTDNNDVMKGLNSDLSSSESESEPESSSDEEEEEDETLRKMREAELRHAMKLKEKEDKIKQKSLETDEFIKKMRSAQSKPGILVAEDESGVAPGVGRAGQSFGKLVGKMSRSTGTEDESMRVQRHGLGEVEISFVPKSSKKREEKAVSEEEYDETKHGRKKQRYEGRRKVTKRAMRGEV